MADLEKKVQRFIVEQLAMYGTPQEVADMVKTEFDVSVTRMQVNNYDPTKSYYRGPTKWKTIFDKARRDYDENVKSIPLSKPSYRLGMLQKEIIRLKSGGTTNVKLLMALLEQGAKEVGGHYTNKREVSVTPTPLDMARGVYRELISEANFTEEEAMAFVTERYNVEPQQVKGE